MQGQHFEQLVHGAEAAGKHRERVGAHRQVHLAHREVVEAKIQFRRDVRIRHLLVRQRDVEADGRRAGVVRAAIGRFHDTGAAAGGDDVVAPAMLRGERAAAPGRNLREFACDLVKLRLLLHRLRAGSLRIGARRLRRRFGLFG